MTIFRIAVDKEWIDRGIFGAMRPAIIPLFVAACLTLAVAGLMSTYTAPLKLYSSDLNYRVQTEALMRGEIALQSFPTQHAHDWAWGEDGMYQLWGLGVPLLRLPFELAARLFGWTAFPDRLVLFIFYFLVVASLVAGLAKSLAPYFPSRTLRSLVTIFLGIFVMLHPALTAMVRTRFLVYEEAICYLLLWGLLTFALLLLEFHRPRYTLFLWSCLAAGFSGMIRPTGFAYGAATIFLLLVICGRRYLRRQKIIGLLLFAIFPIITLFLNHSRFGSALEFGQALNLSKDPQHLHALRFSYPYQDETFVNAAGELLSSIFLEGNFNGYQYYVRNIHPWQTETLRLREFYFMTFLPLEGCFYFAAFLLGLAALPSKGFIAFLKRPDGLLRNAIPPEGQQIVVLKGDSSASPKGFPRQSSADCVTPFENCHRSRLPEDSPVPIFLIWSALSFTPLFLFYLRTPVMMSRYVMDFLPAIVIGLTGLLLVIIDFARRTVAARQVWLFAILITVPLWQAFSFVVHRKPPPSLFARNSRYTSQEVEAVMKELKLKNSFEQRHVAYAGRSQSSFTCPGPPETTRIPYNLAGWRRDLNCHVDIASNFFLPDTACIEFTLSTLQQAAQQISDQLRGIRVRSHITAMQLASLQQENELYTLRFCHEPGYPADERRIRQIAVAWADAEKKGPPKRDTYRLHSIRAVTN